MSPSTPSNYQEEEWVRGSITSQGDLNPGLTPMSSRLQSGCTRNLAVLAAGILPRKNDN